MSDVVDSDPVAESIRRRDFIPEGRPKSANLDFAEWQGVPLSGYGVPVIINFLSIHKNNVNVIDSPIKIY